MSLKTLENSLHVLKYFTRQTPSWGVRELAKKMEVNHSIIYRILSTFEESGYLYQNPETKKYELGLRFLEYGEMVKERIQLSSEVFQAMRRVVDQTNESVFLTILDGNEGVTVEMVETSQNIKYAVSIGTRAPLYSGASCKVMMAYLQEERQMRIMEKGLESLTPNTITSPDELIKDLERIKSQGWCLSTGEYANDVFGLGVPLFDFGGNVFGSLTISGPVYRLSSIENDQTLAILKKEGEHIQRYLKHINYNH
ncbi:IclR family transcriptional regulator [Rossellomorea sp. BNER]|uniref:IclR family transcriptional regulator n=1 Tax=Rossellomorea sp. BNER TaxID=2962031 RepID=UPI003AF24EE3|nr:IclR family transcriptional regulator [Rossellomorea sp. BNER]